MHPTVQANRQHKTDDETGVWKRGNKGVYENYDGWKIQKEGRGWFIYTPQGNRADGFFYSALWVAKLEAADRIAKAAEYAAAEPVEQAPAADQPAVDPVAVDTQLAGLTDAYDKARQKYSAAAVRARDLVGERRVTRGRSRVWETNDAEALTNLDDAVEAGKIDPWDRDAAKRAQNMAAEALTEQDLIAADIKPLDDLYRQHRWSRFYVVPGGHIHSARVCAGGSIRPTTLVGMRPELSGLTEADAVAAEGPYLCSHCFRSAPVEWQRDPKDKPADPDTCTDVELTDAQRAAINPRRITNYVRCSCTATVSVTSTGRKRKHKRGDLATTKK